MLTWHAQGPEFDPQHFKKEAEKPVLMGITHVPSDGWMATQNELCTGTSLSLKKEGSSRMCYGMDKP
jgi:hypothetical protein